MLKGESIEVKYICGVRKTSVIDAYRRIFVTYFVIRLRRELLIVLCPFNVQN